MKIDCPECQASFEYTGANPPRFCSACGTALPVSSLDQTQDFTSLRGRLQEPAIGDDLGPYRLVRELGRGGMGVVYEAADSGAGRHVALKLLAATLPRTSDTVERFLREGAVAARLDGERTTYVYDVGQADGHYYIAMELMPGRTLKDVVDREGPLPVVRAVDHLLDVCDGLATAHAQGLVHRDVKPSNCFLDRSGRIKVGDFGLSRSLEADDGLTRTGAFLGTLQFASPEQIRSVGLDRRTDVYSAASTLFYLLAGRAPFTGDMTAVIAQIAAEKAPLVSTLRKGVPQDLVTALARGLERDPAKRFQTIADFRRAIAPFASEAASVATLGRRLAAFFIDRFLASFLGGLLSIPLLLLANTSVQSLAPVSIALSSLGIGLYALGPQLAQLAYFTLFESIQGRTFGKWLLGLRVIGPDGRRPAFWRAFLRALNIPGMFGLPILLTILAGKSLGQYGLSVFAVVIEFGLPLLWMLTMRPANGFRGLHELLSGTRTLGVRGDRAAERSLPPVICRGAPLTTTDPAPMAGPYRLETLVGRLQYPAGRLGRVHRAVDSRLGRPAWVILAPPDAPRPTAARLALFRPARLRWLQAGDSDAGPWRAYELLDGAPLASRLKDLPWSHGRRILAAVVDELCTALDDGSLPEVLEISQVWIDSAGALRLVDWPIELEVAPPWDAIPPLPAPPPTDSPEADSLARVYTLLGHLITLLAGRRAMSPAVRDELAAFVTAGPSRPALDRLRHALEDANLRPAALTRADRAGVLAVSMSAEQTLLALVMSASIGLARLISPAAMILMVVVSTIVLLLCVPWLAVRFAGGPAFQLLDVVVIDSRSGQPASRQQLALRSLLAWGPVLLLLAASYSTAYFQEIISASPSSEAGVSAFFGTMLCGFVILFAGLLIVLGGAWSLMFPNAGLQDRLAGTELAPR